MCNDWPGGYSEDCIEPPCEIFLQLFIENVAMAAVNNGEGPDENEGDEPLNLGLLTDDDQLSPFNILGDDVLPNHGSIVSNHGSDLSLESITDTLLPNHGSIVSNHGSDLSLESITDTPLLPLEYLSDAEAESELTSGEEPHDVQCEFTVYHSENITIEESESNEEPGVFIVLDNGKSVESPSSSSSQASENCDKACSSMHNEESDVFLVLDNEQSVESPASSSSQISENCEEANSSVNDQENDNRGMISNDLPHLEESSVELETSSSNNGLLPSTYVSLYVVVPPTSFSNESSSDLLLGAPSDRLFSGLIPLNPPCSPSSLISDNDNTHSNDGSVQNTSKISNVSNDLSLDTTQAFCNITSEEDDKKYHSLSEFDSVLNNSNCTVQSDTTNGFNDDIHSEFSTHDINLSQSYMVLENNVSSEIMSENSVPTLKRKVCGSADDNIVNKVPKYTSSQTSNESVNQGSLDYCKVVSNSSETAINDEEDKMDIAPAAVAEENVILTLEKTVEETVNEKPKT